MSKGEKIKQATGKVVDKAKELPLAMKKAYIFFFKNMRYIYIPLLVIGIACTAALLLQAFGYYFTSNGFFGLSNSALSESGEASTMTKLSLGECFLLSLKLEGIGSAFDQALAGAEINDVAIRDQLVSESKKAMESGSFYYLISLVLILVSYFVSGTLLGKKMKKANHVPYGLRYTIYSFFLKLIVFAAALYGLGRLFALFPAASAVLTAFVVPLIESLFALWRAYLVQHGLRKTKGMFTTISLRDALPYLLVSWSLVFSMVAFAVIAIFATNKLYLLALVLVLPGFVYASQYLEIYAQAYVIEKAKAKEAALEEKSNPA